MRRTLAGLVVLLFISSAPAYALWFRSRSVEWQTNVCDVVAIAEVVNTSESEFAKEMQFAKASAQSAPSLQHWLRSQMVACKIAKRLKGQLSGSPAFRHDYYHEQNQPPFDDRPLRPGDKILIFAVEKPSRGDQKVIFWVNLTQPDIVKAQHAAYNNDCKWLADGEQVLRAVQARIDLERKTKRTRQRGLIVEFTAGPPDDLYWDFVRTADPDYKATLIKQLHDARWPNSQAEAMFNLISYPGPDTVKLIRPFLTDASTKQDGLSGATATVVPLRQAAYAALRLLGANPAKPAGFQPVPPTGMLWDTGFEDRVYFPYGDWQRGAE